jgi:hypothetical protein
MNNNECYYLNTWPFGVDPRVKAHIVNSRNWIVAKVLRIELKDTHIPRHCSIPIKIKNQCGKTMEALALFHDKWWFITIEVENFYEN